MPRFHRVKKESDKIPISDYNLKSDYLEALANMKVTGGKFTISRAGASLEIGGGPKTLVYRVKLTEDLPEASGVIGSTATAVPLKLAPTEASDGAEILESDNEEIVVVNRDPNFSAEIGDEILVVRVHLGSKFEWQPLWVGSEEEEDPGFPPNVTCDCAHCLQGVPIPDALECCRSHTAWEFTNPWLECEETDLVLEYMGEDKWITDPFVAPNGNEYRFKLTIDVDGRSYLTLVVEVDNGGDPVCLRYGRDGFDCQCDNALTIKKPWGKVFGIERRQLSCNVCLKPKVRITSCPVLTWTITFVGEEYMTGIAYEETGPDRDGCPYIFCTSNFPPESWTCKWEASSGNLSFTVIGFTCIWPAGFGCSGSGTEVRVHDSDTGQILRYRGGPAADRSDDPFPAILTFAGGLYPPPDGYPETLLLERNGGDPGPQFPTISGACEDEDCLPTDAEPQPQSACCLGDGHCYEYVAAALCADFGGTFYDVLDDCREACETIGACCFPGGACIDDMTEMECTAVGGGGGIFHALTNCLAGLCVAPVGACCNESLGTCTLTADVGCNGPHDYFAGVGTSCDDVDCTEVRCCYNEAGTCVDSGAFGPNVSMQRCLDQMGEVYSAGVECGNGAIPGQPLPDGSCIYY